MMREPEPCAHTWSLSLAPCICMLKPGHRGEHVCFCLGTCAKVMSQTWEVRCSICKELRWPYLAEKPDFVSYVCMRCLAVPPEKRAARVAGSVKARAVLATKRVTATDRRKDILK